MWFVAKRGANQIIYPKAIDHQGCSDDLGAVDGLSFFLLMWGCGWVTLGWWDLESVWVGWRWGSVRDETCHICGVHCRSLGESKGCLSLTCSVLWMMGIVWISWEFSLLVLFLALSKWCLIYTYCKHSPLRLSKCLGSALPQEIRDVLIKGSLCL